MVKLLRRKFIAVAMGSLLAVLMLVLGGINLVHIYQSEQRTDGILWMLASYDGEFPEEQNAKRFLDRPSQDNEGKKHNTQEQEKAQEKEEEEQTQLTDRRYEDYQAMWFLRQLLNAEPHISAETRFSTRYFTVEVDDTGTITQMNVNHIAAVTEELAQNYSQTVLTASSDKGYLGQYKYLKLFDEEGGMIIFLDCTTQQEAIQSFLYLSCGIALLVFVVVLLLVCIFSKGAIAPIISSIEKQKQFITDAGHELKTPLAIISANADVLALYAGENEWVDSIRNQVGRLNVLVQELLILARMEEQARLEMAQLDFSTLVEQIATPFAILAEKKQSPLQLRIEPKVMVRGEAGSLQRLVSVLVDNAVKYVQEGGTVSVTLKKRTRSTQLEIYNSCDVVPEGDLNQLFDRFWRTDLSRARENGGYGIGLSVARVVAQTHHGKIYAERRDQGICFVVRLPLS